MEVSITSAALGVLRTTVSTGLELKKFHGAAKVVDKTVDDLVADLEAIVHVLDDLTEIAKTTRASDFQETGHIGTLWRRLGASIQAGREILEEFSSLLERIAKQAKVLDHTRKQFRSYLADNELAAVRYRLQSFSATVQLNLSTLIIWHQVSHTSSSPNVAQTLGDLEEEIRRLVPLLKAAIGHKGVDESQPFPNRKLNSTVADVFMKSLHAVATVISSASNSEDIVPSEQGSVLALFEKDYSPGLSMQRWMHAEPEDTYGIRGVLHLPVQDIASVTDRSHSSDASSDIDLEIDVIHFLIRQGVLAYQDADWESAQRSFQNGSTRAESLCLHHRWSSDERIQAALVATLQYLWRIAARLDKWQAAACHLRKLLDLCPPGATEETRVVLGHLVSAFCNHADYGRATKRARKLLILSSKDNELTNIIDALRLLIDISRRSGHIDDEEAFTAMLLTKHPESQVRSLSSTLEDFLRQTAAAVVEEPVLRPDFGSDIGMATHLLSPQYITRTSSISATQDKLTHGAHASETADKPPHHVNVVSGRHGSRAIQQTDVMATVTAAEWLHPGFDSQKSEDLSTASEPGSLSPAKTFKTDTNLVPGGPSTTSLLASSFPMSLPELDPRDYGFTVDFDCLYPAAGHGIPQKDFTVSFGDEELPTGLLLSSPAVERGQSFDTNDEEQLLEGAIWTSGDDAHRLLSSTHSTHQQNDRNGGSRRLSTAVHPTVYSHKASATMPASGPVPDSTNSAAISFSTQAANSNEDLRSFTAPPMPAASGRSIQTAHQVPLQAADHVTDTLEWPVDHPRDTRSNHDIKTLGFKVMEPTPWSTTSSRYGNRAVKTQTPLAGSSTISTYRHRSHSGLNRPSSAHTARPSRHNSETELSSSKVTDLWSSSRAHSAGIPSTARTSVASREDLSGYRIPARRRSNDDRSSYTATNGHDPPELAHIGGAFAASDQAPSSAKLAMRGVCDQATSRAEFAPPLVDDARNVDLDSFISTRSRRSLSCRASTDRPLRGDSTPRTPSLGAGRPKLKEILSLRGSHDIAREPSTAPGARFRGKRRSLFESVRSLVRRSNTRL